MGWITHEFIREDGRLARRQQWYKPDDDDLSTVVSTVGAADGEPQNGHALKSPSWTGEGEGGGGGTGGG